MLIQTKLIRPKVPPDLVDRPRLRAILDRGADRRLTVVSAPAGYGKTTLLADWVSRGPRPAAWLSLEPFDRRPRRFVEYLTAAVSRAVPDALPRTWGLLGSAGTPWDLLEDTLAAEVARLPAPLTVVLDDYHELASAADALPTRRLVESLPPGVRLVVSSRIDPGDLPLPLWRSRGWVQAIGAEDDFFSKDQNAAINAGFALLFGVSALSGFNRTSACRDAKEDLRARLSEQVADSMRAGRR